IMRRSPCPILIVTSDVGHHASLVFDAMGAGALDAVDTPVLGGTDRARPASSLLAKIEAIAAQQADARLPQPSAAPPRAPARTDMLVAIGASAGGPAALAALLGRLPVNFGAGVVVVQHVDEAFAPGMADWLDQQTPLTVRLARAGERPSAGVVLLAGGNRHLRMDASGRCAFTDDPTDAVYRPSIDVFLQSVAENWRARAVGVLLTGMGRDGAAGLGAMRAQGFITIAQDRETSAVYGMPKAAAEAGAASQILPLASIAPQLVTLFGTV
ncbi:MAG: chemotaxis-specific protein-glutamate methyltransferase CheB, partial [Pandoraea sp.]|nr:chemotaxis-specific protein-glutamate methyltransferase CheB [Pandoraea sp.]